MDIQDFLAKLLPDEGHYVLLAIHPQGKRQQAFFRTIEELALACKRIATANPQASVYYAISSFLHRTRRVQTNLCKTKVIALDIDCGEGKPYTDWRAGLTALGDFTVKTNLPKPMVVASGAGLHVYYILDTPLVYTDWLPLAQALKGMCVTYGLHIDPSVTADASRVLRPVETTNPKNGNPVQLLIDADPIPLATFRTYLPVAAPANIPAYAAQRTSQVSLGTIVNQPEYLPTNPVAVMRDCNQIRWAIKNQSKVPEPLWYTLMGVASYCADPESVAIAWSNQHPDYSEAETLARMARWKQTATGPATCAKLEADRPNGCRGCKFKGKITSPAQIGSQFKPITPPVSPIAANSIPLNIPVPGKFKHTSTGVKLTIDNTDIDVCNFNIHPTGYGYDESLGYETVRYHWDRPHKGWQELTLRQANIADGSQEFSTAIADQGIVLANRTQTGNFQMFLRSYMEELKKLQAMTNLYATMGWKEDNTAFVLGDTLFRRSATGTVTETQTKLAEGIQRQSSEFYTTAGSLDTWCNLTAILGKTDLYAHMFTLGVALSAPLYHYTGLKGLTVSLYGETGGGKTLAQYWAQSIYGDPDKLHFAAKYTQNSLFSRLGVYANLPMTVDEVTMMEDKDVGDFCYWVSQGRDKARLNRKSEEREAKTWATPVIVSTNRSLQSKLVASGLDTDAQIARLLEVSVPQASIFVQTPEFGRNMHKVLHTNYGHAGRVFIRNLLQMGQAGIEAAIEQATQDFYKKYGMVFKGEERFWEQAIILSDLALKLAQQWNLVRFDNTNITNWVLSEVNAIRKSVRENERDAFDLLGEYVADNAGAQVTVMHTTGQKPLPDDRRIPNRDIRVRVDVYRNTVGDPFAAGTMFIDRSHLFKWLASKGVDYRTFKDDLRYEQVLTTTGSNRMCLGKYTPVKLPQVYVVGFNLSHPRLQGILDEIETKVNDLSLGQLKLVPDNAK